MVICPRCGEDISDLSSDDLIDHELGHQLVQEAPQLPLFPEDTETPQS